MASSSCANRAGWPQAPSIRSCRSIAAASNECSSRDSPTWLPGRSTSATVSAPSRTPATARLRCSTSTVRRRAVEGDLIVGADGIHSTARAVLVRDAGPPHWNGSLMWRGATEWPTFLSGSSMIVAGGNAAKAVIYPIAPGRTGSSRLTNWAIVLRTAPAGTSPPRPVSWTERDDRHELMAHLERFALHDVDLRGLIGATEHIWVYPMCDRDPLTTWSTTRTTLLGDAAHPMYPMGSNGASQAILDARVLADSLASTSTIEAALHRYESLRIPPTTRLVDLNRQGGPEAVIDLVERRAPNGFARLSDVATTEELDAIVRDYQAATSTQPSRS